MDAHWLYDTGRGGVNCGSVTVWGKLHVTSNASLKPIGSPRRFFCCIISGACRRSPSWYDWFETCSFISERQQYTICKNIINQSRSDLLSLTCPRRFSECTLPLFARLFLNGCINSVFKYRRGGGNPDLARQFSVKLFLETKDCNKHLFYCISLCRICEGNILLL